MRNLSDSLVNCEKVGSEDAELRPPAGFLGPVCDERSFRELDVSI